MNKKLAKTYIEKEIEFAYSQNGIIIPAFLGDIQEYNLSVKMEFYLLTVQWYSLNKNPSENEIDNMIDEIGFKIVNGIQ